MTKLPSRCERSVIRSSVIPSAKYSCSGSWLRLVKGRTTSESGGAFVLLTARNASGWLGAGAREADQDHQPRPPVTNSTARQAARAAGRRKRAREVDRASSASSVGLSELMAEAEREKTPTGRAMFFSSRLPRSSKR